ncbi:hypothetical protein AB0O07_02075 [Streptomyces sp. NPDC093085]|uniref:hypothetical protein n=1 Tax=Streptomyces sp. NPDC093085 TaxID=3155068 RepID=UPI003430C1A6
MRRPLGSCGPGEPCGAGCGGDDPGGDPFGDQFGDPFGDRCADRCAVCDRAGAADEARWSLLSRHRTSQGVVEYCACPCGGVVILVDGGLAKVLARRR